MGVMPQLMNVRLEVETGTGINDCPGVMGLSPFQPIKPDSSHDAEGERICGDERIECSRRLGSRAL